MKRRLLCISMIVAICLGGMALSVDAASKSKSAKDNEIQLAIGKLRGKLLYKKNQIRKLEKAALAADPTLEEKVNHLESERQSLYVSVAPGLAELYAAEKDLQGQIDAATKAK